MNDFLLVVLAALFFFFFFLMKGGDVEKCGFELDAVAFG